MRVWRCHHYVLGILEKDGKSSQADLNKQARANACIHSEEFMRDKEKYFDVLDAFYAMGGNFINT